MTPATHAPSASPAPLAKLVAIGLASAGVFGVALAALSLHRLRRERRALANEPQARADTEQDIRTSNALLGMVSHELRTPLQAIMTNADLLLETCSRDEVRAIVERMNRSLDVMASKLDTFSHYARLASGVEPVRRERFSLAELMRRIVDDYVQQGGPSGQAIAIEMDEGPDPAVEGDPVRLRQILDNYLTNAIKYSGGGVIRIRCSMPDLEAAGSAACRPMLEVAVEDRGPGVTNAERRAIWEPYYRGARGSIQVAGSGLGLAVVRLLASSAGWETGVRDAAGGGLAFYVRFPRLPIS